MLDYIDLKCFGINNESVSANYTDFDVSRYESIWPIQTALSQKELRDETDNFKKMKDAMQKGVHLKFNIFVNLIRVLSNHDFSRSICIPVRFICTYAMYMEESLDEYDMVV